MLDDGQWILACHPPHIHIQDGILFVSLYLTKISGFVSTFLHIFSSVVQYITLYEEVCT